MGHCKWSSEGHTVGQRWQGVRGFRGNSDSDRNLAGPTHVPVGSISFKLWQGYCSTLGALFICWAYGTERWESWRVWGAEEHKELQAVSKMEVFLRLEPLQRNHGFSLSGRKRAGSQASTCWDFQLVIFQIHLEREYLKGQFPGALAMATKESDFFRLSQNYTEPLHVWFRDLGYLLSWHQKEILYSWWFWEYLRCISE